MHNENIHTHIDHYFSGSKEINVHNSYFVGFCCYTAGEIFAKINLITPAEEFPVVEEPEKLNFCCSG